MKHILPLISLFFLPLASAQEVPTKFSEDVVAKSGNGVAILHPASTKTYALQVGDQTMQVPEMMAYVPAGKAKIGSGQGEEVMLDGYCIGKFSVTNAEYKEFVVATGRRSPSYWKNSSYPEGKSNHPVVYVSLNDAQAYAKWVGEKTGWNVVVPTSNQWEKAARGPKGFLYPWGDMMDVTYRDGVLKSKFSFNGVTAAQFLKDDPNRVVSYNNKKSPHFGKTTTVEKIAGYKGDQPTYLSVGSNGSVRGWVSHESYTGFIYTDLFTSLNEQGGNTVPVGSYEDGKSSYGCYDMAGNVWNWCDTLITATNGAEKGKTVNEIRGGSWYANGTSCKSVSIGEGREGRGAYNTVGFRIALIPAAK
jgi:formylglycine-generating enzyme required for sulfatase activity